MCAAPAGEGEEDRHRRTLEAVLRESGKGSVLRGWRLELDPDGSLDCNFLQFCRACHRLQIHVDSAKIFGEESPSSLTLQEVVPELGKLVDDFRKWIKIKFGGPSDMCEAFEGPDTDGVIGREGFAGGLREHGFRANKKEVEELFCLLDLEDTGSVACEDVMFLEMERKKREGAIRKRAKLGEVKYLKQFTAVAREELSCNLPPVHRRAPREWHKAVYEQLPEMAQERQRRRRDALHRRGLEARADFLEHLVRSFGDLIRAWRLAIVPSGRYKVTKVEMAKFCKQRRLSLNVADLWRSLDLDADGILKMEELGPKTSAGLALLQAWATKELGSVSALWTHPEADRIRETWRSKSSWKSDKNMPLKAFAQVLRAMRCRMFDRPDPPDPQVFLRGLDLHGCGFVSQEDLVWLDGWPAPTWLSAEPDGEAWAQLLQRLVRAYKAPLRAWRSCLDTDDSNNVSYREFTQACKKVKFTGNIDGAWRHLDQDISGLITLEEFDIELSKLLLSFKTWVENNFGAVEAAFRSIDSDGSGTVSHSELRRGCHQLGWDGDVGRLFDSLQVEKVVGTRTLSFKDLLFLETWVPQTDLDALAPPTARQPPQKGELATDGEVTRSLPPRPHRQKGGKKTLAGVASCPPLSFKLPPVPSKLRLSNYHL